MGTFDTLVNPTTPAPAFAALSGAVPLVAALRAAVTSRIGQLGVTVGYNGSGSFAAVTRALSAENVPEFFPEAVRNAANPDLRAFTVVPGSAAWAETGQIGWNGAVYIISRVEPANLGQDLDLMTYRLAQPNSATTAPEGETGAGSVKPYQPPASPY